MSDLKSSLEIALNGWDELLLDVGLECCGSISVINVLVVDIDSEVWIACKASSVGMDLFNLHFDDLGFVFCG